MKEVYSKLEHLPNTDIFTLIVEECPFCQKRHIHGGRERTIDSPCYYNEDGTVLQGGMYHLKIDWSIKEHADLQEAYQQSAYSIS